MRFGSKRRALAFALVAASLTPAWRGALAERGALVAAPHAPKEKSAARRPPAPTPHGAPDTDADEDERAPRPAPAPSPKSPAARPNVTVKDGMVRVPGGTFKMGSDDKEAPPNERPSRVVVVAPFWIDRTEVTVGAYRACVDRGACARPARSSTSCTFDMGDPALPVSCVPWTDAQAYCVAAGKRLPREVEWELAARGTQPIKYPWGGSTAACSAAVTLAGDATQRSCGGKRPARVASRPAGMSPFGAYDMSGNVEEWVADWYAEGVSDLSPRAGASHVLRGGGWLSPPSRARTTSRNWGSAREMGPNVGFRCARADAS